jgi:exonuclease SbcC
VILSLSLTGFMAHADTTLEFAPGFNVLCGPNNTGKSAVVEALRCLANNPSPRHVIRHGASEARVEALFEGGWRVAWVRRKSHALYEVFAPGGQEPEVFAKLGKSGVPAEVAAIIRLGPVCFEKGEPVDVHLGDQRHPIFLLDQPGSVLADFLASSTESAHLMAMQDLLREKAGRAKREAKRLEEEAARARAGLDALAALPGFSLELERLREEGGELRAGAAAIPALEKRIARLEDAGALAAGHRARADALARAAPPPVLGDSASLAASIESMRALIGRSRRAAAALSRLEGLAAPPALSPASSLAGLLGGLEEADRAATGARRRLEALSALSPPPAVSGPEPLASLLSSMETLAARVAKGAAWLARRQREIEDMAERIAKRLDEAGECPLCGSRLDAKLFLKKAGGRGAA